MFLHLSVLWKLSMRKIPEASSPPKAPAAGAHTTYCETNQACQYLLRHCESTTKFGTYEGQSEDELRVAVIPREVQGDTREYTYEFIIISVLRSNSVCCQSEDGLY